jgi:hypothetical protein
MGARPRTSNAEHRTSNFEVDGIRPGHMGGVVKNKRKKEPKIIVNFGE